MTTNKSITYNHFGKPADVWKHLALCEVIKNEHPEVYMETNSACADYDLSRTPEQEYGIYNFIERGKEIKELVNSTYYKLENEALKGNRYIGSPGLAMCILGEYTSKFIFYDVEAPALSDISRFAQQYQLGNRVRTIHQNSLIGVPDRLSVLPSASTLIHIDPYTIDQPSSNGLDYLDIFTKASEKGIKCILWYGFNTLDEKEHLNTFMRNKLLEKNINNLSCIELIMKTIQKNTILCNPGIVGNGILTGNLSAQSTTALLNYSRSVETIYKNTFYKGFKGDVYRDIINLTCNKKKHIISRRMKL